jgi:DNA-binding protein YbaB
MNMADCKTIEEVRENINKELSSKIDAGLELISALGAIELKPIEIRDLLYKLITKDYNTIDKILEAAQKEKLLKLTEKTYLMTPEASNLQFEKPKIIKQEESATCRYCRKKLSTGYYVVFKSITYGPYGSSCIRKIYLDHLL